MEKANTSGPRYIFDIEANGFLDDVTKVHCIVLKNADTGEVHETSVEAALGMMYVASELIGHNIISYDIPVLEKLHSFKFKGQVTDTFIMSKIAYPNLKDRDDKDIRRQRIRMPLKLKGRHGLEAWGYRVKLNKGDYKKEMEAKGLDPWSHWSPEMQEYCVNDVLVTERVYAACLKVGIPLDAFQLEFNVQQIIFNQIQCGYGFLTEDAEELERDLRMKIADMTNELTTLFPAFYMPDGKVQKYKKTMRYKGELREEGAEYQKVKLTVFNPGSRSHIANRLIHKYGWKPKQFTDGGQPKVDEDVLKKLKYPEAKQLAHYFEVKKLMGMLADGDNSWLKYVKEGRIHGALDINGTTTFRGAHSKPNIGQVPSAKAFMGPECRRLFGPWRKGWVQCGMDASGLELRCLGHYLARHDGGEYGRIVVDGDIHQYNADKVNLTREQAKRVIYAWLYGSGFGLLGELLGGKPADGKRFSQALLKEVKGLKDLVDGVKCAAKSKGYLKCIDGRRVYIRSDHSALNFLLQSAGAIICKMWMVEVHRIANERIPGKFEQMAWVHDEFQFQCEDVVVAHKLGKIGQEAIKNVERKIKWRVPLASDYQVGENWYDCH